MNYWVRALGGFDDKLFAGGQFTIAGGEVSAYVAAWDKSITAVNHGRERDIPANRLLLLQNVPNPFNPSTTIPFVLPKREHVRISVYNVEGKLVKNLLNGVLDKGLKRVRWDGTDSYGRPVSSGVYFCRLNAAGDVLTKKMVLLR
jgi:hypothetical protein